jgi:5-enolpyruvylshikimate-3-phosphate synthase
MLLILFIFLSQDELVSQPYVDMTVKLMQRFGVTVELLNGLNHIRVSTALRLPAFHSIWVQECWHSQNHGYTL